MLTRRQGNRDDRRVLFILMKAALDSQKLFGVGSLACYDNL